MACNKFRGFQMQVVSYSKMKNDLQKYILDVNQNSVPILITNQKGNENQAILISKSDYDSLMEKLHLHSAPIKREIYESKNLQNSL
jgi:prevent-host-death family protein